MENLQFVGGDTIRHASSPKYYELIPTGAIPPNTPPHHQPQGWRFQWNSTWYTVPVDGNGRAIRTAFPEEIARHGFGWFIQRPSIEGGEIRYGMELQEVDDKTLEAHPLEVRLYACPWLDCDAAFEKREELRAHILGVHVEGINVEGAEHAQREEEQNPRDLALSEIARRQQAIDRGERPTPEPFTRVPATPEHTPERVTAPTHLPPRKGAQKKGKR